MKPKDEFKIGDEVFIVLEQNGDRTKVIFKEFAYNNKTFGGNSCWKKSNIRTLLNNDYYNKIAKLVGENNIIPMKRDLTSLDGLDDYGVCYDRISLLSVFEYAKYHKILGLKPNYSAGWWVITPYSTPSSHCCQTVCSIDTRGTIQWAISVYLRHSVRPFFTLKSSTIVVPYKN